MIWLSYNLLRGKELIKGDQISKENIRLVACNFCSGKGKCGTCLGTGKVMKGLFVKQEKFCTACNGLGICSACEGDGKVDANTVKIKCPKCLFIINIKTKKRPYEFNCPQCGMKLILRV